MSSGSHPMTGRRGAGRGMLCGTRGVRVDPDDGRAGPGAMGDAVRDPCSQDRPEVEHSTPTSRALASVVPYGIPHRPPGPAARLPLVGLTPQEGRDFEVRIPKSTLAL